MLLNHIQNQEILEELDEMYFKQTHSFNGLLSTKQSFSKGYHKMMCCHNKVLTLFFE